MKHVILLISYSFDLGYSLSTISTYISGIGFFYKLRSLADRCQKAVGRLQKITPSKRRSCTPQRGHIAKKICSVLPEVCYSPHESYLFRAAFLTAYFGLLRVSELVFTSPMQANRPLLFSDVKVIGNPSALLVSIKASKTNQAGAPTVIQIPPSGNPLCCVLAVHPDFRLRPDRVLYFFSHSNGTPLIRNQFSGVLSKAIRNIDLPYKLYISHSFCIGRASDLASKGVSNDNIKNMEDRNLMLWMDIFAIRTPISCFNVLYNPLEDIWLIGSSLIAHLQKAAIFRRMPNLCLPYQCVLRLGSGGMRWRGLMPKFQLAMLANSSPNTIVVHLGGNNLTTVKQGKSMGMIKKDLFYMASSFPSANSISSDILLRL